MGKNAKVRTLGAIVYKDFELLDLYGPLEMFGNLKSEIDIVIVAEHDRPVASFQGPQTVVEYDYQSCPPLDLVLLPGGFGTLSELENQATQSFLRTTVPMTEVCMSVCTGSWLLAKAGLLEGLRATSNKMYFKIATQQGEYVKWIPKARWVQDGCMFTASGVSAGMDMSLAVIAKLFGKNKAMEIANLTEYIWNPDADEDPFHQFLNSAISG